MTAGVPANVPANRGPAASLSSARDLSGSYPFAGSISPAFQQDASALKPAILQVLFDFSLKQPEPKPAIHGLIRLWLRATGGAGNNCRVDSCLLLSCLALMSRSALSSRGVSHAFPRRRLAASRRRQGERAPSLARRQAMGWQCDRRVAGPGLSTRVRALSGMRSVFVLFSCPRWQNG